MDSSRHGGSLATQGGTLGLAIIPFKVYFVSLSHFIFLTKMGEKLVKKLSKNASSGQVIIGRSDNDITSSDSEMSIADSNTDVTESDNDDRKTLISSSKQSKATSKSAVENSNSNGQTSMGELYKELAEKGKNLPRKQRLSLGAEFLELPSLSCSKCVLSRSKDEQSTRKRRTANPSPLKRKTGS